MIQFDDELNDPNVFLENKIQLNDTVLQYNLPNVKINQQNLGSFLYFHFFDFFFFYYSFQYFINCFLRRTHCFYNSIQFNSIQFND